MKKISVNKNIAWTTSFVNELSANGLKFVCISPGSRNTPLTLAFVANKKIKKYVSIDERSSGFLALGMAKVKNEPVAVVTTSGTATAEIYPAIIEAYKQRVPLIICTADRPPGFFERGANQTINQQNIYSNHIRFFYNMDMPRLNAVNIKNVRKTAKDSLQISTFKNPGPVHINFPFDKPFEPEAYTDKISTSLDNIINNKDSIFSESRRNYLKVKSDKKLLSDLKSNLIKYQKGLIIVGPENYRDNFHKKVILLSEKLNYPILADGASQLRFKIKSNKNIIANYDAFLRASEFSERYFPEIIIHFGRTVTSKGLEDYLAKIKCQKYLINEYGDIFDPSNNSTAAFKQLPSEFCEQLINNIGTQKNNSNWIDTFIRADSTVNKIKEKLIFNSKFPTESRVITEILNVLPNNSNIMLSNSMPVRDFDYFASNIYKKFSIYNNRGASGVDGIISTAVGIAERTKKLTVLLTGDIAFYYDLNGLLLAKKISLPLIIILINNKGGGIFRVLPISKYRKIFEKYFLTPHNLNFKIITKGFGVKHTIIKSWNHLRSKFNQAKIKNYPQVLEIRTDSKQSFKIREQFWLKVRQSI